MQPNDLNPPADCLAGHKWYVWSDDLRLILLTELGPVDAALKLLRHALEHNCAYLLGESICASQTGFTTPIFRRDTIRFAERSAGIPQQILFAKSWE